MRALNHLGVLTQPSSVAPNVAISPAVRIAVQDARGTVGSPDVSVTIALSTNPGGGTLSGTLTQLTVNGIATFNDLSVNNQAVGYTLIASAPGLAGVTTAAFTVTAPVDAGQSTVSVSSPVNVNTLDTITVTAKDAGGNPLIGKTVSLAVSGSGNTVNQPGSATDGSGVATGSFQSSVAETKTVQATAGGVLITQQPSVVVQSGGGPTPILDEQFNWPSQSAFLADSTIYSQEDPYNNDPTTNILNTSPVFGGGVKSYQALYASQPSNCSDYTPAGRNLKLPSDQTEIWCDSYWIFSAGFKTLNTGAGCSSGTAQKLFFGRVRTTSRFQVIAGANGGQTWETGYPTNEEPTAGMVPTGTFNMDQFADGSTVLRLRNHWRVASSGVVCEMWMQNTKVISLTGDSSGGGDIYGIAYLRNLNQGPPAAQNIRIGRIIVYNTNPGW